MLRHSEGCKFFYFWLNTAGKALQKCQAQSLGIISSSAKQGHGRSWGMFGWEEGGTQGCVSRERSGNGRFSCPEDKNLSKAAKPCLQTLVQLSVN